MEPIFCIVILIGILWVGIKLMVFLWSYIIIPTCAFFCKMIVFISILVFFVILYVGREEIVQWIARI